MAPRLYVITDRRQGDPIDVVTRALASNGGAGVAVQLREKDLDGGALLALARALRAVTARAGAALFVNDRVDVALAAGADGVHLGGGALSVAEARALGPRLAIGVSAHEVEEVEAAAAAGADFAVFGPVFDTPSKRGIRKPVGVAGLARACAVGLPLLALGGVTPENASACARAGAAGAACIRSVICATDPAAVARLLLDCFDLRTLRFES